MKEENVERLFNALRNAPAETSLQEVSTWLDKVPLVAPKNNISSFLTTTNIVIMTTIAAVTLTGLFLLGSTYQPYSESVSPTPTVANLRDTDLALPLKLPVSVFQLPPASKAKALAKDTPALAIASTDVAQGHQVLAQNLTPIASAGDLTADPLSAAPAKEPVSLRADPVSGLWRVSGESLSIDTLFAGVDKLVFEGKNMGDLDIRGSKRKDLSMNLEYSYKVRGLAIGKNQEGEVRYTKNGGTLTIVADLTKNYSVMIGSSRMSSRVFFEVPDDIEVNVSTTYGDITAAQLAGRQLQLKTSYGDIAAKELTGDISLRSGYGDIDAHDLKGKTDLYTKYGHILLAGGTGIDSVRLYSGYGDIDCQLKNPSTDCVLELKTGYGKIKVKGSDLDIESSRKLQFGRGRTVVNAVSSYGDILIKYIEK